MWGGEVNQRSAAIHINGTKPANINAAIQFIENRLGLNSDFDLVNTDYFKTIHFLS